MSKIETRRYLAAAVLAATFAMAGAANAQYVLCPGGPCKGVDPGRLPRPAQYVSPPDMLVEFSTCPLQGSAAASFVLGLQQKLAGAMTTLDVNHDDSPPAPEVRQACVNGKQLFGGWLYPVGSYGSTDTATARNVGLSRMDVLAPQETFAFHFRSAGIDRLVNIRWRDQPRTLDDDGTADPNGDVHLTGYDLYYTNKDALQRTVVDLSLDGWYDGTFSNTDIAISIFDFLTVNAFGGIDCDTGVWAGPTETTIDTVLASFTGGAGGSLGDVVDAGPACKIAQTIPRSVLVPGTPLKAVFTYQRVSAYASTGLTFAGTWEVKARTPNVTITGPALITVEPDLPATGQFSFYVSDMSYPLKSITWTASGGGSIVSGQSTGHATATWTIPGLDVGEKVQRNLTLTVVDADNTTVTRLKPVSISCATDTDIDPVCKHKPSLPQCRPDGP